MNLLDPIPTPTPDPSMPWATPTPRPIVESDFNDAVIAVLPDGKDLLFDLTDGVINFWHAAGDFGDLFVALMVSIMVLLMFFSIKNRIMEL